MSPTSTDVFNVKEYGAVGDGVHDDAPAIQAALDACAGTGGKVVIPGSMGETYLCTTPVSTEFVLAVGSNTYIEATGATIKRNINAHMLLGNWRSITDQAPGYTGNSFITIDGGTWDGNPGVCTANNTMVFSHAHDIVVRNATFKDTVRAHAIDIGGVTDMLIENCIFDGMFFSTTADSMMYREAIQVDYCGTGNGHGLLADFTTCQRILVTGCVSRASTTVAPPGFVGGPPAVLAGQHSMASNPDDHVDIAFINNVVEDCRFAGFRIIGMRDVLVSGNTIKRSGLYGAGTVAYSAGVSVDAYGSHVNTNVRVTDNGFGGAGVGTWVGGTNASAVTQNTGNHLV